MTRGSHRRLILRAACGGLLAPLGCLGAPPYPDRPIKLIVPWPAGASTDRHLRLLAELAAKHLGQRILIDNKPGGSGALGAVVMAQSAPPDGYTVSQYQITLLRLPHMQQVSWHPIDDFSFIIGLTGYTFGITVRGDSPFNTLDDYISAAREHPGTINYGSSGVGTTPHLAMEELALRAKVNLVHVPFKGTAEGVQALLGGHVMAMSQSSDWEKFATAGRMRVLATFGAERTRRWPHVPTARELGYDVLTASFYGIAGPRGLDPGVVKTLHDGFKQAMDEPAHVQLLDELNQERWYRSSEAFREWAVMTFAKEKTLIDRLNLGLK